MAFNANDEGGFHESQINGRQISSVIEENGCCIRKAEVRPTAEDFKTLITRSFHLKSDSGHL